VIYEVNIAYKIVMAVLCIIVERLTMIERIEFYVTDVGCSPIVQVLS